VCACVALDPAAAAAADEGDLPAESGEARVQFSSSSETRRREHHHQITAETKNHPVSQSLDYLQLLH